MKYQTPKQHRGNGRYCIRLKQVRSHACAVADVISHIVCNDCRISRIVFGDSFFNFTNKIRADISRFRVNASTESRKYRNETSAKPEAYQCGNVPRYSIKSCNTQKTETNNKESGNSAALYRNRK